MKYKMGDIVRCVPGYQNENPSGDNYGGIGYEPNKVFVVYSYSNDALWTETPSGYGRKGIYVYAVEPYIPIPINKNVNKHQFI
jgi:hypothetical protein